MLFGIACHTIGERTVGDDIHLGAIEEEAVVETIHLLCQLIGVAITVLGGDEAIVVLGFVAAKHENVVYSQEVQVDKCVFGLNF